MNTNWPDIALATPSTPRVEPVRFVEANLSGARFVGCNLTGAALENCAIQGMTIGGLSVVELLLAYQQVKARQLAQEKFEK